MDKKANFAQGAAMTYLVTFTSHFDAILARRLLMGAGLSVELMPVPRTVSASCGTCVTFAAEEDVQALKSAHGVKVEKIYYKAEHGWELLQ